MSGPSSAIRFPRCIPAAALVFCSIAVAAAESRPGPGPAKPEKPVHYPGGVTVYPKNRWIIMEGIICPKKTAALEWGVVASGGKDYESIAMVDAQPSLVHFALIALGFDEGGNVDRQGDPRTPTGAKLDVFVQWRDGGEFVTKRLEELVWNDETDKPMLFTPFVFTGSMTIFDKNTGKARYIADEEKIIVALYRDPSAILNNPLKTGQDDIFYIVNKKTTPPRGTPVAVILAPAGTKPESLPRVAPPPVSGRKQSPKAVPSPPPAAPSATSPPSQSPGPGAPARSAPAETEGK